MSPGSPGARPAVEGFGARREAPERAGHWPSYEPAYPELALGVNG